MTQYRRRLCGKANLQRYSDCPADWYKCECHSLSPAEEEEEEEPVVKAAEEKRCVNVSLEKRQTGF